MTREEDAEILSKYPQRQEYCHNCRSLVKAKLERGLSASKFQVMAFFKCHCGENWHYDIERHDRKRRMVR